MDEVQAFVDLWAETFNQGDVDALALFYTDHARVIPPSGPMLAGEPAIRGYFSEIRSQGFGGFSFELRDLIREGGLYIATGNWGIVGPGFQEMPHRYHGNWINVLNPREGGWRIAVQMWN